jgi:hypothetical protein
MICLSGKGDRVRDQYNSAFVVSTSLVDHHVENTSTDMGIKSRETIVEEEKWTSSVDGSGKTDALLLTT